MMAQVFFFVSFLLANLVVLLSAQVYNDYEKCEPFFCNPKIGNLSFPFKESEDDSHCGLFSVDCSDEAVQKIQLKEEGYWYEFTNISNSNISIIIDKELQQRLQTSPCDDKSIEDLSLELPSQVLIESITNVATLLNCSRPLSPLEPFFEFLKLGSCINATNSYYYKSSKIEPSELDQIPSGCAAVELPLLKGWNLSNPPTVSSDPRSKLKLWLGLGFGLGLPAFLAACLFLFLCYRKRRASKKMVLPSNTPNSNLEGRSFYKLGVPVFTYKELEEATNHFNCDKEIGDGGFGIVYHGKLKDGREVAVKRLYEHNCRRAEQFMNEIEILTHLHHNNLVTLYGCTSRHSRDLLLVYEYISNGTVADHLHGDRAASGLLTWPMRMSIARETASALCYLHASDIVHRDVKTTNILLDKNFTVKVSDFGISRIFPLHATHVSTAPQGTPGYVDPEYHQCYQLTPKSDVYSFGVVLIELISSLPAVDITRHREEINLSNLAINRIRNGLYSELVDASLGFESDDEVKRMTIAVAELAFRCLQQDSNARPAMREVLEDLKQIENQNDVPRMEKSIGSSPSPYSDQIGLLKSTKRQSSPSSVIQNWTSTNSTATNFSA